MRHQTSRPDPAPAQLVAVGVAVAAFAANHQLQGPVREGALDRVPAAFVPVVDAARALITETFGRTRLHSAYLYGSIPRGTATPGVSDLGLRLALHDEPTEADRADARAIEAVLDRVFPQVDGVGILLTSARVLLSDVERHDGGFLIALPLHPVAGA
jgi:uncharacterized protein